MSIKHIVIEGTDQCGKTEIAKELASRLGMVYFKNRVEWKVFDDNPEKAFDGIVRFGDPMLLDFIDQSGSKVIFDRAWPSEWVYSNVFNRESFTEGVRSLDNWHALNNTHIIICTRKNLKVDDLFPEKLNLKRVKEIDNEYREFAKWTNCKCHFLSVDDENLDREIDEILDFLDDNQQVAI